MTTWPIELINKQQFNFDVNEARVNVPITSRMFLVFQVVEPKLAAWIVLLQFFTWSIRFKDISLQILQEFAILNIPLEISANCIEWRDDVTWWWCLRDGIFSVTVILLYKLSSKRKKYQIDVLFLGVLTNRTWRKEFHFIVFHLSLKLRHHVARPSSL